MFEICKEEVINISTNRFNYADKCPKAGAHELCQCASNGGCQVQVLCGMLSHCMDALITEQ